MPSIILTPHLSLWSLFSSLSYFQLQLHVYLTSSVLSCLRPTLLFSTILLSFHASSYSHPSSKLSISLLPLSSPTLLHVFLSFHPPLSPFLYLIYLPFMPSVILAVFSLLSSSLFSTPFACFPLLSSYLRCSHLPSSLVPSHPLFSCTQLFLSSS